MTSSRAAHWVIRSGNLRKTIDFLTDVFGMVCIRHEENEAACAMTCNGRFNRPWSKTMVGYKDHLEDKWFCLEVTYNYGIKSYKAEEPCKGLLKFVIGVTGGPSEINSTIEKAQKLGYEMIPNSNTTSAAAMIKGPDDYVYEVKQLPENRQEPFLSLHCAASQNQKDAIKDFYCNTLKMSEIEVPTYCTTGGGSDMLALAYPNAPDKDNTVPLIFEFSTTEPPQPSALSGRFALSYDGVAATYNKIIDSCGGDSDAAVEKNLVIHKLDILKDKLGDLEIAIVKDPVGYELCLVTNTVFDGSTREAANWQGPDWEKRAEMGG